MAKRIYIEVQDVRYNNILRTIPAWRIRDIIAEGKNTRIIYNPEETYSDFIHIVTAASVDQVVKLINDEANRVHNQ